MKFNLSLSSLQALSCFHVPSNRNAENAEGQSPAPASTGHTMPRTGCPEWLQKAFEKNLSKEKPIPQWENDTLLVDPERGISLLKQLKLDKADVGAGSFGSISIFKNESGEKLVGKFLHLKDGSSAEEIAEINGNFERELEAFKTIYKAETAGRHPNLVNVYGIAKLPDKTGALKRAIVMDAVPGPTGTKTFDALRKCWDAGKISSSEYWGAVQFVGRRMLDVIEHMGKAEVVHNDIKPDNFLVNEETGEPVLIDLGGWCSTQEIAQYASPAYSPPEVLINREVDETSDMFSAGASLLHGIEGKDMERSPNQGLLKTLPLTDAKGNAVEVRQPGTYSAESAYTNFMAQALTPNQAIRPSVEKVKNHAFLTDSMLDDGAAKVVIKKAIISLAKMEEKRPAEKQSKQPKSQHHAYDKLYKQAKKEIKALKKSPNLPAYASLQNSIKTHPELRKHMKKYVGENTLKDLERKIERGVAIDAKLYTEQTEWFAYAKKVLDGMPAMPVKSGVDRNGVRLKPENEGVDLKYAGVVEKARMALAPHVELEALKRYVNDTERFLYEAKTLKTDNLEIKEKMRQVRENATVARRVLDVFELSSKMSKALLQHPNFDSFASNDSEGTTSSSDESSGTLRESSDFGSFTSKDEEVKASPKK